jgi:hypothetical protein
MREFASDGCTGFLQSWRGIDLSGCCRAHDLAWWLHPGDWPAWWHSNLDLAGCIVHAGAIELGWPFLFAVTTVGAVLFATKKKDAGRG